MKAAILRKPNTPLSIEEVPMPIISHGEILVKVAACGVCHTDLHYIDHGVLTFMAPPIILGHEASGIVEIGGHTVKNGQRVLIPSVFACGKCKFCLDGRENICKTMIMPGNHINGAFAQYIKVPEKDVLILPKEIPLEEACIISDAISTPYHAVINRAKVKPSENVFVLGCGGVGINVVQIAALLGATIIACDTNDAKLEKALELGAKYAVNPHKTDVRDFLKQNKLKIDVAFEVIGNPKTIEEAYKLLGIGGRLCVIGYTNHNININPAKIMFQEQEIFGSLGCSAKDYPKIFELVISGKIKLDTLISNRYELENINHAFDEMRKSIVFRNIILPNGHLESL